MPQGLAGSEVGERLPQVARGLGLEPYPDKVAKPAREPGAAPVLRKPRRDPSDRQAAPPVNRAHLKASPPWIGELSARDLAELLMSMPEGELEDRCAGMSRGCVVC